jgi:hypothetical protein
MSPRGAVHSNPISEFLSCGIDPATEGGAQELLTSHSQRAMKRGLSHEEMLFRTAFGERFFLTN